MTHLIVGNEGDLEHGIKYATKVALNAGHETEIEFTFTSKKLMQIFAVNLFDTWVTEQVPQDVNLDLTFNVPGLEEDDDDDTILQ